MKPTIRLIMFTNGTWPSFLFFGLFFGDFVGDGGAGGSTGSGCFFWGDRGVALACCCRGGMDPLPEKSSVMQMPALRRRVECLEMRRTSKDLIIRSGH